MNFSPIEKSQFSKSSRSERESRAKAWDYGINVISPTAGTVRANLRGKKGERTASTLKHMGASMAGGTVGMLATKGSSTGAAIGNIGGSMLGTKLSRQHAREGGDRKLAFKNKTLYGNS